MPAPHAEIVIPRELAGEDFGIVTDILFENGSEVEREEVVAILSFSKAAVEIEAPRDGYIYFFAEQGDELEVGTILCTISDTKERPKISGHPDEETSVRQPSDQIVTLKAGRMIDEHDIPLEAFSGLEVVRTSDVDRYLRQHSQETKQETDEWDDILNSTEATNLEELLRVLRDRMQRKYHRHVPTGDLLNDRWALAKRLGFGEGTSVYDQSLILGDVTMGKNCWVGPFTVLDGAHAPLKVGKNTSIGAGSHVYTHHTIDWALTGGKAPTHSAPTSIGNCCFIAPQVVIGPGTSIGDHCFVASGSYVEGSFPDYSYIAGTPAKCIGKVEIGNGRARLILTPPSK